MFYRSLTEVNTFVQIQGVSMTVLGIFAGAAMVCPPIISCRIRF
jgi:hypothetical protein